MFFCLSESKTIINKLATQYHIMAKVHRKLQKRMTPTRSRKKRPKTFKTEEAAKKHAEKLGLKGHKLVNISTIPKKKKIKIVAE